MDSIRDGRADRDGKGRPAKSPPEFSVDGSVSGALICEVPPAYIVGVSPEVVWRPACRRRGVLDYVYWT